MTYIRDLDPQWHDPELDRPVTCPFCGVKATVEDMTRVWARLPVEGEVLARTPALLCSWCGGLIPDA